MVAGGYMLEVFLIRALVVDDHPQVRQAVRRLLEHGGEITVVGETDDGTKALLAIDELAPDIVLLDVNMPGMDGFGVLGALQHKAKAPKVVVLTMYSDSEVIAKALSLGASAVVAKQRTYRELLPAVRAVVEA